MQPLSRALLRVECDAARHSCNNGALRGGLHRLWAPLFSHRYPACVETEAKALVDVLLTFITETEGSHGVADGILGLVGGVRMC